VIVSANAERGVIAFAGPSLTAEDRALFPDAEWRPPAEAGDLMRLLGRPAPLVCLIDGYFDHRPAVRHKELLLLLAEGATIYGAASIGALRAAEMAPFGMIGVGAIFRAYAGGRITGDDEVALAHAPAEWLWRPLSVPLVDVRATLCRAVRAHVLRPEEARAVRSAAASIHYAERSWESVLEAAALQILPVREADGEGDRAKCGGGADGLRIAPPPGFTGSPSPRPAAAGRTRAGALHPDEIARLRAWLPAGAVPQKRIDALACLSAAAAPRPEVRRPALVRTLFLDALARECGVDLDRRQAPVPPGRPAMSAGRR
jgi:hypothetical protein